jgi:hypothetical protein
MIPSRLVRFDVVSPLTGDTLCRPTLLDPPATAGITLYSSDTSHHLMGIQPGPAADSDPRPTLEPEATPEAVRATPEYYYVRVRPRDAFVEFRTPLSSPETPTTLVVPGCDVREGRLPTGEWLVESLYLPAEAVADEADVELLAEVVLERWAALADG